MLQLPTTAPTRRFTKAEIADMTRGAKQARKRMRPAVDPTVKLVVRADAALDAYISARAERWLAEQKVDKADVHGPHVYIPDELLNMHWSNGFQFTSERHIEQQFKTVLRSTRETLKRHRANARRFAAKKELEGIRHELTQHIAACERRLVLLPKFIEPMKITFRMEARRLATVHRKAGLTAARDKGRKATRELHEATELMRKAKPSSEQGAMASIGYVERRLWCDKPGLFMDDGYFPSDLGRLLRRAHTVLWREVGW